MITNSITSFAWVQNECNIADPRKSFSHSTFQHPNSFPSFFFRIPIWNISCFQYSSDPNKFEQNYTNDSVGVWKWKRKFFVYKSITCKFWSEMEKKDKDGKWLKLVTSTINVKISEWKSFFKWERKISREKKHNKLFFFSQLFVLAEDKFLGNSFTK